MRRALLPLGVLVVGGLLITGITMFRGRGAPATAIEVDEEMPPIDRATLDGGRLAPAAYRGRPVVVNFWASWCAPCRTEQPGLLRLHRELGERVAFIGVNFKDDRAAALAYVDEFGVVYPSVVDRDGLLAHRFGVPYLPATIIVDERGRMRYRLVGAQTEETLRRYLEELPPEAPA